jgi:FixJ family two-component response regulator
LVVHVVDDDEAVRDSMRALLESFGLNVKTYASARDYLLTSPVQPCGCMLLDLHMPGMSGLELMDVLHGRGSKLPIIAMTGRSDAALKERVARAGAMTLLDKPVADETLLTSLSRAFSLGATPQEC